MVNETSEESKYSAIEVSNADIAVMTVMDEITRARASSDQFFIAANLVTVMFNFSGSLFCLWASPDRPFRLFGVALSVTVFLASMFVCLYWARSNQEFFVQHETRFRALMDHERIYSDKGILSKSWDRIGDYRGRSSPVFFLAFARYMPVFFISINLVPLYAMVVLSGIFLHTK